MKKKILLGLLIGVMSMTLVGCGNNENKSGSNKKAAKFSGEYVYNLPTDNYYVETEDSIKAKVGKKFTYREKGSDDWNLNYHINSDYDNVYVFYNGEWVIDTNYDYSEYEDSYIDIYPLSAMEDYFMKYFRAYGFEDEKLEEYYVGNEKVAGVDCWVFDSKGLNSIKMKYWIDPSNGATLKYEDYEDNEVYEVIKYDLNYTKMDTSLYPSSYEGLETW